MDSVLPAHPLKINLKKKKPDFPGGTVGKSLPANAGDAGLIPGSGRSLEEEISSHSSILAWEIPWTEEPGGLQSTGVTKSQT